MTIPGLPDDIALECLIRLPKVVQLQVRSVSKCWNELLSSEEFHTFRALHNFVDDWLLLVLNNTSSSSSLLAYDFQTSLSHRIEVPAELQEHLRYFGVCCTGYGHLSFFIGGSTSSTENLDLYNHGELSIFDVATSSWRKGASMNTGRSYFASGFIDGYLYVAGGCDNERTAEVYDIETDSWRYIASMPFGFTTIESFTVFKGRLYMKGIVGGVRRLLIYDPRVDAWEEPREFENGMKEGQFVATKENLYLINKDGYIGRYDKQWKRVGSVSRYFMPYMSSSWGGLQSMYFGKDLFLIKSSGEEDLMDLRSSKQLHKAVLAAFLQCQSVILSM